MNGHTNKQRMRSRLMQAAASVCLASGLWWSPAALADQTAEPTPADVPAEQSSKPADAAPNQEVAAPPVDPALLEQWVRELDDDRYAVREAAQKKLAAAGSQALATVSGIAAAGSLESSTRAVSVLVGWADASDKKLGMAALEQLAALQNRPIEAAMAHERLAEFREAAALEAIKELGGRFDYDRQFGMVGGPSTPLQIIIGPKWKGGVEGLKHVAALRSATTLSLHSAPLGDEAAEQLAALPQIRRIELYGTEVSPEAVAKLQPRLPNTMIDVRSGARLGIRGLIIEQVVDDSPAAVAGLERNDKITEFAGQPIETFEQLTQQIAKCKPGDTVTVKVLRNGATVEKKVTFDRWGDDERSTMPGAEGQQGFVPVQIQGGGRVIIQPGGQILPGVPIQVQQRR
jgi:hypothetical protein